MKGQGAIARNCSCLVLLRKVEAAEGEGLISCEAEGGGRRSACSRIRGAPNLLAQIGSPTARFAAPAASGLPVVGTYRRSVQVGMMRMAVIENSREFTLVPWRPVLERQIGREVSGIMRGSDISWTFGRQRSGPEI